VFPNPTTGVFTIRGASLGDIIRITTTTGQLEYEQAILGEGPVLIQVTQLPAGIHLLEITGMERRTVMPLIRE